MPAAVLDQDGAERLSRQRRRKTALEMMEFALPAAWGVYISGRLIAGWGSATSTAWGVVAAAMLAAYWKWHRSRYPARVSALAEDGGHEPRKRRERPGDARSIWAWDNLLLVVFIAVAMVATVVVGLLVAFILPLAVVVGFVVVVGGASGSDVGLALLATLGVAIVVDVGVVHPLARYWGLPVDGPLRRKEDFCPPSPDGSR